MGHRPSCVPVVSKFTKNSLLGARGRRHVGGSSDLESTMKMRAGWFGRAPPPPPPPPPLIDSALDNWSTILATALLMILVRLWWSSRQQRLREAAAEEKLVAARRELASRGTFELEDLSAYVGRDKGPILMAVGGNVYDVTAGREFYGVDGCYSALAGKDATRLLAKGILEPESADAAADPLTRSELDSLRDWEEHYEFKYERIGTLVACAAALDGTHDGWQCVLDPQTAETVRVIEERSGLGADAIAAMLQLDVAAVRATLEAVQWSEDPEDVLVY
eukprot:796179-Prymnesium_polylepis.1